MKLFSCDHCGNTLYFENALCEQCGHLVGYLPRTNEMIALRQENGVFHAAGREGGTYVFCDNARHDACNWLIEAQPGGDVFCLACRHNETIPDISDPQNKQQWQVIERAKKRLFYSLLRLGLPLETRAEDPEHGLSFRFLADIPTETERVMTGHDQGIITLALAEADDAEREARRAQLGEPYRTLLGHFRHEVGHHYWDLLVDQPGTIERCRALFGDDRLDYGEALQRHYETGAPAGWPQTHITAYATAHAWEDFAETWAHFLHITDTLETANAFNLRVSPEVEDSAGLTLRKLFDPYAVGTARQLVNAWVPVAGLVNNLNRSMGLPDAYPFVLTPSIVEKLEFINSLTERHEDEATTVAAE